VEDYRELTAQAHAANCKVAVAADILSLALLTPPGEWDADVVFGSTQRLGVPLFYGGPSAAYFATRDEYKRNVPGRIMGGQKISTVNLVSAWRCKRVSSTSSARRLLQTSARHKPYWLPWPDFIRCIMVKEALKA
jgi:hypothetical protein